MKIRTNISIAIIICSAIQFIAPGCHRHATDETLSTFMLSDSMMTKCEFYTAKTEEVQDEIRLFGKITADNNKMSQVFSIVSGIVKKINVELGDYVKQGQVLASVQSSEVATYQKEQLDAINDIAVAEKNLQVAKDLFDGKLNSEKDVIAAQREFEKAKAELTRINEIYSIYNLKGGSIFNITAPISGFIVTKNITPNEQILVDNSVSVFSIAEIDEVWVLANVNESDIPKVREGYSASVKTLAFPDTIYKGKIDKIFNAIDPDTKSMKALIKIPNTDLRLKPEMNCTVSVNFSEGKSLVAIPSTSVIFDKSKYWIMVFNNRSHIETRKIEIYRQYGGTTYITSGIKAGETVISKNGLLVYDAIND